MEVFLMESDGKVIGSTTFTDAKIAVSDNFHDTILHLEDVNNGKTEIRIDFCKTGNDYYQMIISLVDKTGNKIDKIMGIKMPSANMGVLGATWMQILESQKEVK
jgi:hypothetical protein